MLRQSCLVRVFHQFIHYFESGLAIKVSFQMGEKLTDINWQLIKERSSGVKSKKKYEAVSQEKLPWSKKNRRKGKKVQKEEEGCMSFYNYEILGHFSGQNEMKTQESSQDSPTQSSMSVELVKQKQAELEMIEKRKKQLKQQQQQPENLLENLDNYYENTLGPLDQEEDYTDSQN